MIGRIRTEVRVDGIVQGVGFRPFVHGLAIRLGLAGLVGNDARGVVIEVEGDRGAVAEFVRELRDRPPALASIERITSRELPPTGREGFRIAASEGDGERRALVSPDTASCDDCLREMADPGDRRYRYPFINCTNCGPRFTIITDVPYDRPNTTMAGFTMCAACAAEYNDPADRRFHAQPICCPDCGPELTLRTPDGAEMAGEPVSEARRLMGNGVVIAVKGVGGYHLAAAACDEAAVATLRGRKHREQKPFAVMVADLGQAHELCHIDSAEEKALTSSQRPIVLLERRHRSRLAGQVAPDNRSLGVMLPYTPLHHLLITEPTVLTSGNVSDEPIAYHDDDAFERLAGIADAFLTHDRPIHIRTDDSVTRIFGGRERKVRRSRGYVPRPIRLRTERPVLACGAELKNTFCLAKDGRAFVSHHIGDLENYETLRAYTDGIEHFKRLFAISPQVLAHDLHPEYLSTKYAVDQELPLVAVQHHHAHIASCMVDNDSVGPVIGVAFDGLGYGSDGTLWGGEFLLADLKGFSRLGHLVPVPLPGGTAAIKEPWRMAAGYGIGADSAVARRHTEHWETVVAMADGGINAPLTSSMGRLFDAVAAVLGVRDKVNYEGQAAVELEQRADLTERGSYPLRFVGADPFTVPGADLVAAAAADTTDLPVVSARFHNTIVELVVRGCVRSREVTGVSTVALSGGVFQNLLLLDRAVRGLRERRFEVLTHHQVPANDGGISLGQAAVAGCGGGITDADPPA